MNGIFYGKNAYPCGYKCTLLITKNMTQLVWTDRSFSPSGQKQRTNKGFYINGLVN